MRAIKTAWLHWQPAVPCALVETVCHGSGTRQGARQRPSRRQGLSGAGATWTGTTFAATMPHGQSVLRFDHRLHPDTGAGPRGPGIEQSLLARGPLVGLRPGRRIRDRRPEAGGGVAARRIRAVHAGGQTPGLAQDRGAGSHRGGPAPPAGAGVGGRRTLGCEGSGSGDSLAATGGGEPHALHAHGGAPASGDGTAGQPPASTWCLGPLGDALRLRLFVAESQLRVAFELGTMAIAGLRLRLDRPASA